jgi:hypothetical protein
VCAVLSGPGSSIPVSDYSRTAWCLNEEVVILREAETSSRRVLLLVSLPILLGPRKTGRERPDFPSACRTYYRKIVVKGTIDLVNAREGHMRGAC